MCVSWSAHRHTHAAVPVEIRGLFVRLGSFLSCGSWGPNSGCQGWWPMPFLAHISPWPYLVFLTMSLFCKFLLSGKKNLCNPFIFQVLLMFWFWGMASSSFEVREFHGLGGTSQMACHLFAIASTEAALVEVTWGS